MGDVLVGGWGCHGGFDGGDGSVLLVVEVEAADKNGEIDKR